MSQRRQGCALMLGLLCSLAAARGQYSFTGQNAAKSVSGQFFVSHQETDQPAYPSPELAASTNLLRLKTTLLAVAAERFKTSLWQQLGLPANAAWSGKIYLLLHPARSADETVTIASRPFLSHWYYEVGLPDLISKGRYARSLSAVLLLELANRGAQPGGHAAELPAWLVDGLAQQILGLERDKVLLSVPVKPNDGFNGDELLVNRLSLSERGLDALASSRQILQTRPALTFDQLSWPASTQMNGADGGVYLASAQLFVSELLALKDGREKMRAFLAGLPGCLNWQTAFFRAFHDDFRRPLEVEKWWSLRVVNFAAHAPGSRWTTEVSLARLQGVLSVPVEYRASSNSLPSHTEISLQAALQNLGGEQRDAVLRTKVRDLALVELRLAPPFGELADHYRTTLSDFLSEVKSDKERVTVNKGGAAPNHRAGLAGTIEILDGLDYRRREAEAHSTISLPSIVNDRTPKAGGAR
jgi:hypothetical protein